MNTNISELIGKATFINTTYKNGIDESEEVFDKELFAKLIIQECINKCEFVAEMATLTNDGEMARKCQATANSCAKEIKRYFEIKE